MEIFFIKRPLNIQCFISTQKCFTRLAPVGAILGQFPLKERLKKREIFPPTITQGKVGTKGRGRVFKSRSDRREAPTTNLISNLKDERV